MNKMWKKIVALCLICILLCSSVAGCGATSQSAFKRDEDNPYLLGLCEALIDTNLTVEPSLTIGYISEAAGILGIKTYRVWMNFATILTRDPNSNEVLIKEGAAEAYHKFFAALKENGVERICAGNSNYLHPYGYDATTHNVVPDPFLEQEEYLAFLELYQESYRVLATEFPEVNYFEPTNEAELTTGQNLCRNGYEWGGSDNGDYMYTNEELAHILADLCFYAKQGVQSVNKDNRVLTPALCAFTTLPDFLEQIYSAIESGAHPSGQEKAYTNPDSYFDILNWHPYLLTLSEPEMDENWVALQKRIYAVAENHGDSEKSVWFSEMGFSDRGTYERQEEMADNVTKMFDYIDKELPFIETVCFFRLTNLAEATSTAYENNFGLFYSLLDKDKSVAGQPKPTAIALYKWFYGEDADLTPLYDFANYKEE